MLRGDNGLTPRPEHFEKPSDIESMPHRSERHQIFFRQPEQTHRRIHSPPIFRVGRPRMLLLQMDESASRLDEALEKIRVL